MTSSQITKNFHLNKMPPQSTLVLIHIIKGKLDDESYVQVMGNKIRHIKREKNGAKEIPIKNKIVLAICSGKQIFAVLYGG